MTFSLFGNPPETTASTQLPPESYLKPESIMHCYTLLNPSICLCTDFSTKLGEHSLCTGWFAKGKGYEDGHVQPLNPGGSGTPREQPSRGMWGLRWDTTLVPPVLTTVGVYLGLSSPSSGTTPEGRGTSHPAPIRSTTVPHPQVSLFTGSVLALTLLLGCLGLLITDSLNRSRVRQF